MATARRSREDWIQAGLNALSEGGPDAVRVEELARRLGVTKGGFYWAFNDRETLLDEMLVIWERTAVDEVVARIDAIEGDAQHKLRALFAEASSAKELSGVELAIRDWARRDQTVRERLQRVDNRRMAFMRRLFAAGTGDPVETEARCLLALTLFVGIQFTAPDFGRLDRQEIWASALEIVTRSAANSDGS